jgi:hypothetical protein
MHSSFIELDPKPFSITVYLHHKKAPLTVHFKVLGFVVTPYNYAGIVGGSL